MQNTRVIVHFIFIYEIHIQFKTSIIYSYIIILCINKDGVRGFKYLLLLFISLLFFFYHRKIHDLNPIVDNNNSISVCYNTMRCSLWAKINFQLQIIESRTNHYSETQNKHEMKSRVFIL